MQEQAYMGLPHCGRLSNGTVEAVVSLDVGPRVLRYGLVGGDNVFGEYPHLSTPTELGDWKPYGGHRLWAAPEAMPRSYAPDNTPIQCTPQSDLCARLTQPTDAVGLQKRNHGDAGSARHQRRPPAYPHQPQPVDHSACPLVQHNHARRNGDYPAGAVSLARQ